MSDPPVVQPTPVASCVRRDRIGVVGPDAVSYLQGQLSQDVAALAVDDTTWTFVLSPQGKVEGWGRLTRVADDAVEIIVDPGCGPAWDERLRRFLLRTRAEIVGPEPVTVLVVRGQGSESVVDGSGSRRPAGWPTVAGFDLVVGPASGGGGDEGVDALLEVVDRGATTVPGSVIEGMRIAEGVPSWGSEIDTETIPATLGQWVVDVSVSFTKGCYTGQELVARIDSRGGNVPRRLHRLELDTPPPAPGTPVLVGEVDAGPVTSSAATSSGSVALAWIARSVDLAGAHGQATVGGAVARVLPPPGPYDPER